jgi:two-component system KDP operon response regulator KdpE
MYIETSPDLLILDLGNEEGRVLRLCEGLRAQNQTPILVVGLDNRWLVPALSAGADDYLAKPIDLPTLVAKALALMRRASYTTESRRTIRVRDLAIDLDRCQVSLKGVAIALTPIEYRILAALARRAGRVLTCAELLREAQGYDVDEQEARDIIKVHVYHLRRKLEPGEAKGDYVKTVPGFGYMLERRATGTPSTPQAGWVKRGVVRQEAETL